MNEGWVKIHRSILDSQFWLSDKFNDSHAWIDLILLANHKDSIITKRGIRLEVKRGYVGWSERVLADRWKWSRGKVRRFFDFLIQQNMIQIEQQKNKISALIKIVKYDIYQGNGTTDSTTDESTDGQQTDNKRYQNKNDKKEKNIIYPLEHPKKEVKIPDWVPLKTFQEYVDMRKRIKKPLNEQSYPRFFSHLEKLCQSSDASPEDILNQSIVNGWQGIFELRRNGVKRFNEEDLDKWAMK